MLPRISHQKVTITSLPGSEVALEDRLLVAGSLSVTGTLVAWLNLDSKLDVQLLVNGPSGVVESARSSGCQSRLSRSGQSGMIEAQAWFKRSIVARVNGG